MLLKVKWDSTRNSCSLPLFPTVYVSQIWSWKTASDSPFIVSFYVSFCKAVWYVLQRHHDGGGTLIATWRILPVTDYEVEYDPGVLWRVNRGVKGNRRERLGQRNYGGKGRKAMAAINRRYIGNGCWEGCGDGGLDTRPRQGKNIDYLVERRQTGGWLAEWPEEPGGRVWEGARANVSTNYTASMKWMTHRDKHGQRTHVYFANLGRNTRSVACRLWHAWLSVDAKQAGSTQDVTNSSGVTTTRSDTPHAAVC